MSEAPDIVWVSPQLMSPPRSGASLRTHRLLGHLASSARVRLVVVGDVDPVATRSATGVEAVDHFPRARKAAKTFTALTKLHPTDVAAAWSRAASEHVQRYATEGSTVVVDHLQMAPYLPRGRRHVVSSHNADSAFLREQPIPAGRAGLVRRFDIAAKQRIERRALREAGLVIAVSEHDASLLGPDALVIPNGTDVPTSAPAVPATGLITFVGAMTYRPNVEAVQWWHTAISPRLGGNERLSVIGRADTKHHLSAMESVDLLGEVDDVGPWLAATAIVAVPLLHGSGTRLKILEAMAWGRPVVSTPKGVEGLPVSHGRNILVAADADAFAAAIRHLRENTTVAAELGHAARQFARDYSWDQIAPRFTEAVLALRPAEK